jgi:hypothetical protein
MTSIFARRHKASSASGLPAVLLALCALMPPMSSIERAGAQSVQFDPAHPFANVKSAEEWEKIFIPGRPNLVANDPYGNITSGEFWRNTWRGQGIGKLVDLKGSGGLGVVIRSPYPYKSAEEHYKAWLGAAGGGTKKTRATLPDWSGDWQGNADGVLHGGAKVSDVMAAVAEEYKPRFAQLLRAEMEGRHWWPTEFCLPWGFGGFYSLDGPTWHFMMDQTMVLINKDRNNNETRYIYTDGRGFLPQGAAVPAMVRRLAGVLGRRRAGDLDIADQAMGDHPRPAGIQRSARGCRTDQALRRRDPGRSHALRSQGVCLSVA